MIRVAKAMTLLSPKIDEKKKDIEDDCQQIMDRKLKKWLLQSTIKKKPSPVKIAEKDNREEGMSPCELKIKKAKSKLRINRTIEQLMPELGNNFD